MLEAMSMCEYGTLPAGSIKELWLCRHEQEFGPCWKDVCAAVEDIHLEELTRRCKG